jgi:hypothetical protein
MPGLLPCIPKRHGRGLTPAMALVIQYGGENG